MPLDLLVPDLLPLGDEPSAHDELRMPALERWLTRADRARRSETTPDELLASAYSLAAPRPVAAVSLCADEGHHEGNWLRADPVHLRVGQDAVSLHHSAVLGVTRDEANALVAELQALFRGDGLEFRAPVPERWYVRVPEGELPTTIALDAALGRNIFGLLPQGEGRINWRSAITETQMVFSGHEVNQRREAQGLPAINSVWFWGGGAMPAGVSKPYALVYADDPFARGLGILSSTRVAPLPRDATTLDAVPAGQTVLVVLDSLTAASRRGDRAAWKKAAEKLDDDWFVGLADAVERFEAVRIILPARNDTLVAHVTAGARWRWLRKRKPLAAHG
ncbi:MAG: hypothetical protein ABIR98_12105 [Usitatibacter sp.]